MEFRIAAAGRITGTLLQTLVGSNQTNAIVCYGVPYSGSLPALNANCGRLNKLEQAVVLRQELEFGAIEVFNFEQAVMHIANGHIAFGRNVQHTQGRDIVPIAEEWQLEATRGICDFYTPYYRSSGEFRTWVYRNRHLGSYRKVLARPDQFKRFGRNYKNGFVFERVENDDVPQPVKDRAVAAVRALGLDFGAVDMLDCNGSFKVLEVNAAPGVADERRQVIQNLAHRIQRWAANGCPGRK